MLLPAHYCRERYANILACTRDVNRRGHKRATAAGLKLLAEYRRSLILAKAHPQLTRL